jgi:putative heme-binding domain-containing protein
MLPPADDGVFEMNFINKLLAVSTTAILFSVAGAQEVPVELPAGFTIAKVAGNDLVPDASAMTVGPNGSPIVSGPGYVRRLLDNDKDGVFDSFETLAETKGIAQGIWFDGDQMWLTVDGALKRSVSREEDKPFRFENVVEMTTDQEHGSHAIRKGRDGWWYVICGNATEIRKQYHLLPDSPVDEPRAGFVMRFPPDVKTGENFAGEIFCHGFRNAYDFDFDSDGNLFVYDSDGERDISLPWYRPTRIFKMKAGDDAGWVSAGWKRPGSYFDMPELVGELGRGSPTGVAVCDSKPFGELYDGAAFVGDWTFGRIGVAIRGGDVEIFAKSIGSFGFAVTDLEFAPNGDLYVTTGGRGTVGSLYRISAKAGRKDDDSRLKEVKRKRSEIDNVKAMAGVETGVHEFDFDSFAVDIRSAIGTEDGKAVRHLQLQLGGCEGDRMFAGHQAKKPVELTEQQVQKITANLQILLDERPTRFETARLIGMLRLGDDSITNSLSKVASGEPDPVTRIHYLNCLALAGGKLAEANVALVAEAFLLVRREIEEQDLPVDRNWVPRMSQLANKLFRDMRIPEAIVKNQTFGMAADVWIFDSLPPVFYDAAVAKIAGKIEASPQNVTRQQLRCISVGPRYRDLLRSFSDRVALTDIIVKAIHTSPIDEDWELLLRGLKSFDLGVNKASLIGLRKLSKPVRGQSNKVIQNVFCLERGLGWSNPEVSVRDQIVLLFQHWADFESDYQLRQYDLTQEAIPKQKLAMERWWKVLDDRFDAGTGDLSSESRVKDLLKRIAKTDFSSGDSGRGKVAFEKFQCATCHDGGGKNSGPSLSGVASRFSREDIFSAIVDPNANVPDRYRAILVATEDGQVFQGSVVYESMAGIMLATGTGEVVRIDAANIEARRKTKSLMPEGLLNEATDQEIADLWAWLKDL